MTPERCVQAQLDAYNAHDLEGFLAAYADDVCLYRRGVSDAALRSVFEGQNITVRYRLMNSNEERTETYPLDQLLTFQ